MAKRQGLGLGFLVGRHGVLHTLRGSGVWQIHAHHGAELLKGTESAGGGDILGAAILFEDLEEENQV